MYPVSRTQFCGQVFHQVDLPEVLQWIAGRGRADPFAYVVTPNVDHIVRLSQPDLCFNIRRAYRDADLVVNDSRVLKKLARLRGHRLSLVPGSDIVASLIASGNMRGARIALVGGDHNTLGQLREFFPGAEVHQYIPPMNLLSDSGAREKCADFVCCTAPDLTLLAVGSPQQELIAKAIAARPDSRGTGLCIGAAVDFVTGKAKRAPKWMQHLSLEWLHRLASNPARLWKRYLVEGPRIFLIALRFG